MRDPKTALLVALATALPGAALAALVLAAGAAPAPSDAAPAPARAAEPRAGAASLRLAVAEPGAPGEPVAPGTRSTYSLEAEYVTRCAEDGGAGSATLAFRVAGSLCLDLLARREGEVLVALTLPDVALTATSGGRPAAERQGDVERALGAPAVLRLSARGELLGCRFAAAATAESRSWVRALCATFRFAVRDDAGAAWTTEEHDATGRWTVRYSRTGARVARTRAACEPHERAAGARVLVTDDSECTLDAAAGWVERARCAQTVRLVLDELGMSFEVRETATLALTGRTSAELPAAAVCWDGPWADAIGREDQALVAARRAAGEADAALVGASPEGLLAEIETCAALGPSAGQRAYEARDRLAALLRARPAEVERLAALLRAGSLSDAASAAVLGAAGSAATEPAQRLLADVATDAGAPAMRRLAAVQSMFQLGAPSPRVVAAARDLVAAPEPVLRASSLLLFGCLAARVPELRDELERMEARARADGRLSTWLEALGNAGAWSTLERHAAGADAEARARAGKILARR